MMSNASPEEFPILKNLSCYPVILEAFQEGKQKTQAEWRKYRGLGRNRVKILDRIGLVKDSERSKGGLFERLPYRVANILIANQVTTEEDALKLVKSGGFRKLRGAGARSEKDLCEYLGIEPPTPPAYQGKSKQRFPSNYRFNPYTGEKLAPWSERKNSRSV